MERRQEIGEKKVVKELYIKSAWKSVSFVKHCNGFGMRE